eukprot:Em0018g772a
MGGWSREHTRPADILVPNWVLGKPAAFDLPVTSMLNAQIFQEVCVTAGSAALAAQIRKHRLNDERCWELGWVCIPLVVEIYGCRSTEAIQALLRLAIHVSTRQGSPKSLVCNEIFGRLSLALVRANSRAILSRYLCPAPVVPVVQSTETITLQPDFNILSVLQSFPKDTAAGPSGLRVQHLLDVANIPLPTPICSSLRSVINMLAAGKAPSSVSRFLAGGSLIALNKNKECCAPDIRPIAVGETLRRLVGKCMCVLLKVKAADFFQPLQFGVACRAGAKKVIHGLRICIEVHWSDDDFVACKLCCGPCTSLKRWDLLWAFTSTLPNVNPSAVKAMPLSPAVMCFLLPNLDILGAPVGNYLHCSRCIADKCAESKKLLTSLVDVAGVDLQVAFTLLHMCGGGFCKLVHLTRVTPPSLASDALVSFDEDVRQCFVLCSPIEVSDTAWKQAQLSLRFRSLGLRSLSCHAAAAYIASLSLSGPGQFNNHHLQQAVIAYNSKRELSSKIDEDQFKSLLGASCPANKARLLSVSAPHSSSWVSVIPSMGLGLHMESNEFQTADVALDPLGHHAVTCRHGGDVVIRHNHLRDVFVDFCQRAHLSVSVEKGHGLTRDDSHTRPADMLIAGWDRSKPAAFDVTVKSPPCPAILRESCRSSDAASTAAKTRKLLTNGPKCQELGLTSHLTISLSSPKPSILADFYNRMNFTLVRSIARAILAREFLPS